MRMKKKIGANTKRGSDKREQKVLAYRNRLNGEIVQVLSSSKTKVIDGVEFLEILVHGRTNLMRKEHLQQINL